MCWRKLTPIDKEVQHIIHCHFIDLRGRVPTTRHKPRVDVAKIYAGRSVTWSSPAYTSPSLASPRVGASTKPPRCKTVAIAAPISGAVASISPRDEASWG